VRAVDFPDASDVAELAVRQALLAARDPDVDVPTVTARFRNARTAPVEIHLVREVGVAVRGGHLDVRANSSSYPNIC
jgi:hypothetical protein